MVHINNLLLFLFLSFSNLILLCQSSCNILLYNYTLPIYNDGTTYNDDALLLALSDCKSQGGGKITIPAGKYLLSPFNLTSNIELHLERDCILLATTNHSKWNIVESLPSYPKDPNGGRVGAFISGSNISNVSITGHGTIDGQGIAWWEVDGLLYGRPRLIEPMYCNNFKMINITIMNPAFWAIHPYACNDLLFENIIYSAPINSPNTDGIDPDSCSHVVIRNFTTLSCGDDAIAIKSGKDAEGREFGKPSHNILIEGGRIGPSSGINIGSEMSGDIYDVMIRNVEFNVALFASRIKSGRGRGGKVYNITFQDLTLKDTITGLAITMYYSNEDPAPPLDISTPHIYDIYYQNITGNVLTAGIFGCLPESECRSLTVQDINLYGIIGGFECFRATGNQIGTVIPESCF